MALGNKEIMAHNLKQYANANNVLPIDIARMLDVAPTTVYDWFNAKTYPRIDKIEQLAKIFGVAKRDLVEDHSEDRDYYYLSAESRKIAHEISEDKDLRLLFDAARDVPAEDLQAVHTLLKSLKKKEKGET